MSSHVRQGPLAPGATSRKRKARDEPPLTQPAPAKAEARIAEPSAPATGGGSNNKLLAGYLAHEFLTKGTLLGQPRGTPPVPTAKTADDEGDGGDGGRGRRSREEEYMQVAYLLKGEGAHIPGIVNPTQLARWLRI